MSLLLKLSRVASYCFSVTAKFTLVTAKRQLRARGQYWPQQQAVAHYGGVVLNAFGEAGTALTNENLYAQQFEHLDNSLREYIESVRIANRINLHLSLGGSFEAASAVR
jgi:hypothetical protein